MIEESKKKMHEDSEKRVKYAIDFADPCRVRTTEVSEAEKNNNKGSVIC